MPYYTRKDGHWVEVRPYDRFHIKTKTGSFETIKQGWVKKDGVWREIWPEPVVAMNFLPNTIFHGWGRLTIAGEHYIDVNTPNNFDLTIWGGSRLIQYYHLGMPRYRNINHFRIRWHLYHHEGAWRHPIAYRLMVYDRPRHMPDRRLVFASGHWRPGLGNIGPGHSPWFQCFIGPEHYPELEIGDDYDPGDGVWIVAKGHWCEFAYEGQPLW